MLEHLKTADDSRAVESKFAAVTNLAHALLPKSDNFRDHARSGLGKLLALYAAAWASYPLTNQKTAPAEELYKLPESLEVKATSLPYTTQKDTHQARASDGRMITVISEKKVVNTQEIDFSKEFFIQTDRYTYEKGSDFKPSQILGQIFSIPSKLFFLDKNIGAGLDIHEAKAVLAMLEQNQQLSGSYVRVNHNDVFKDLDRLFTDPKVIERNNLAARILLGIPSTFLGEIFAELRRGDYYNPMTQTSVLYSNVRSISAHELGHHQDYQRFSSDWWYALARPLPPVMIYKEWQASKNAKDTILAPNDAWQANRYLMPAFCTYLIASYYMSEKFLKKAAKEDYNSNPDIRASQVMRHAVTSQGSFYAGLGAFGAAISAGLSPPLAVAALLGVWMASRYTADKILQKAIPYEHDEEPHYFVKKLEGIAKKVGELTS